MELRPVSATKPLAILAGTIIVLAGIKAMAAFFAPLFLALVFAAILSPIPRRLGQRGVARGLAVLAGFIAFALIFVFLGWVLSVAAVQIGEIASDSAGKIDAHSQAFVAELTSLPMVGGALGGAARALDPAELTSAMANFAREAAGFLKNMLLTTVLFIFALAEGPSILRRAREIFGASHPLPLRLAAVTRLMVRYVLLRTIVNLFTGVGIALICLLMDIPDAGLWGLLVFILSYIPYIGMFIACIPPALLAFADGGFPPFIIFILLSIIVNGLAEQAVAPLITGKGLRISPILIFLAFLFWGSILGGPGYLLAVPLTVAALLFFGAFDETKGIVGLVSSVPVTQLPEPTASTEASFRA